MKMKVTYKTRNMERAASFLTEECESYERRLEWRGKWNGEQIGFLKAGAKRMTWIPLYGSCTNNTPELEWLRVEDADSGELIDYATPTACVVGYNFFLDFEAYQKGRTVKA